MFLVQLGRLREALESIKTTADPQTFQVLGPSASDQFSSHQRTKGGLREDFNAKNLPSGSLKLVALGFPTISADPQNPDKVAGRRPKAGLRRDRLLKLQRSDPAPTRPNLASTTP